MTPETYSAAQDNNDCVVRALANASGMAYADAFELCESAGRKTGRGMNIKLWLPLFEKHIGIERSGYLSGFGTIKSLSKKMTEKGGTYIVRVRGHLAVFKDGEWVDWLDSNRMHRVKDVWRIA